MKENDLQKAVIDLARLYGYRVAHFPRGQNKGAWMTPLAADAKGFPDLVCVNENRIVFLELKSDRGSLTTEQKEWRSMLTSIEMSARGCVSYAVVRPKDWAAGDVERLLR